MSAYLLDTNVVSLPIKPGVDPRSAARVERIAESSSIAATTLCELLFGVRRMPPSERRMAIDDYLNGVVLPRVGVLPYDQAAADWHAAERARLGAIGQTPPFADGQIAAVAATNRLTLVTLNGPDFGPFEGLAVEAW